MTRLDPERPDHFTITLPGYVLEWLSARVDPDAGLKNRNLVAASVLKAVVDDDLEAHGEAPASHG